MALPYDLMYDASLVRASLKQRSTTYAQPRLYALKAATVTGPCAELQVEILFENWRSRTIFPFFWPAPRWDVPIECPDQQHSHPACSRPKVPIFAILDFQPGVRR